MVVLPAGFWSSTKPRIVAGCRDLWGQTTSAALKQLNRELGPDFRLLTIGPAGENGVRFAGIVSDVKRTTARGGAGAVMGVQKPQGIAVRGAKTVPA
jgi:aldehyde:ferredoxin oxidoreductase